MKTKKIYCLGLPIMFLINILLIETNWLGWNELIYNDEYPFIGYFEIGPWLGQSLITIIGSICGGGFLKYLQQRKMKVIPTFKQNRNDVIVITIAMFLGYLLSSLIW